MTLVAVGAEALVAPGDSVEQAWPGLAVVAAGLLAAEALLRRCRRRLGGVTGDVLGACIEVSLTASLVLAALLVTT